MRYNKKFKKIFFDGLLVFMTILCVGCGNKQDKKASDMQQNQDGLNGENVSLDEGSIGKEKYPLPVMLDSERLELISVFEYTGMNPDCEDTYSEEIGAIQLKNVSGNYLKWVELKITMTDGVCLEFSAEDVPADMEVMAFELQNQVYDKSCKIENIEVIAEYDDVNMQDNFTWNVNGSEITVENISNEKKKDVNVYYHCTIDGLSYGGISYELSAGDLQPGESVTVMDMFCFVGDVTVVNITCK